jgi:hypothetical protein
LSGEGCDSSTEVLAEVVLLEKHEIFFLCLFVLLFFLLTKTERKVIFEDGFVCVLATTGHECL